LITKKKVGLITAFIVEKVPQEIHKVGKKKHAKDASENEEKK